ncbi:putative inorganic phosphate cotransporter [Copidosoma floridanum]|uniref:putative inorganic phosphate cotransporter n=1 Tax=Copidosoma floridanum TaxID=29053 RepID=UPI000C6F7B9C|nr:putative inorganic phosphate cotransporter [Copidosoma floridanum]
MEKHKKDQATSNTLSSKMGWRHIQILMLFFGMALGYIIRTCVSVAVVAIRQEYEWKDGEDMLVLIFFFIGYIIGMMPSGYLVGVWSAHKILTFSILLSSALHTLGPFVAQYGYIVFMCNRFIVGATQGCLVPSVYTLLSRWVPPLERARLGSFVMNGPQFGTIIGMLVSGFLASSPLGWHSVFYIFGIIGVIWSIIFFFVAADSPSSHSRIKPKEATYINGSLGNLDKAGKAEKLPIPWKAILTSKPLIALLIVHCGYNWGLYVFFTVLPTYMDSVLGFSILQGGGLSSLPYVAMWILGFPIGYASDWALSKGYKVVTVRKIANSLGLWIPTAAVILMCTIPTSCSALLVVIITIGVGFNSGVTSGFQINHIDLSPNFAGTMMSITNLSANIMGVAAQFAFKYIVTGDRKDVSQWNTLFLLTGGIYFLSNLVFLLLGEAHIQPWNNPPGQQRVNKRVSIISITGEPTTLFLPEQIEEEEESSCSESPQSL